jgi:hypothetical protein
VTAYRIEFGPAWPVPPITVDYSDPNTAARTVAEHAIPHLKPVLAEKGHPEYADCFFHTDQDRTAGQFMWINFQTGGGARFCPARLTPIAACGQPLQGATTL